MHIAHKLCGDSSAVEMMGGMVAEKEMVMEAKNVNELHEILLLFFSYE